MANIIRIKRNTTNSDDPTISQLKGGELAYNDLTDKLFIGKGESSGHASTVELIGGKGAFVTLATAQTISGAKSFVNNAVNFCYGINIRDLVDTSTLGTISGNSTQVRLESKVEDLRLVNNNGASRLVISDVRSPATGGLLLGADGCANLQVQSSSPGLVVTQLGSGLALQINESSNDTTPFVITGGGYIGIGTDAPQKQVDVRNGNMQIKYDTANALGALIQLKKGRGSATAPAIVLAGDTLGTLSFSAYGESAGYAGGATVEAKVASGQTVSPTSLPTNLVFSTTPNGSVAPVAAMTIGHDKVITVAGRITGLSTPTQDTDAATKAYVDAARSGLDVKASVRAASTANVTVTYTATGGVSARGQITAAPNTLDGVTLAANDRILLKDQSTGAQNGIWVVTTVGTGATGVWDRATDFDSDAEVTAGSFTFVTEGTVNSDSGWVLTTNDVITIGGASGTALVFAQFSGAGQIIAGAGLTKNGNTLDVVGTANRITVNADSIDIASTYVGQSSITTLGTIGTGTWQGTAVAPAYGGTGLSSYTVGDLIYASGATTLAKLAGVATGNALISGGVGVAPSWGKIGLTTHVSGTLPIANGGTNSTATPTNGGVSYGTGSAFAFTAAGTAGQALVSTGAAAPVWATLTLENLPDAWAKRLVKAATTANITLSGTQTVDGIALVAGDRVLVKNQTNPQENGIYVVAAGAWSRSADADAASELSSAVVAVDQGTVNGGDRFGNTFKTTGTLGTTACNWYRLLDSSDIGANVQAYDATLAALASLAWSAGTQVVTLIGDNTVSLATVGSAAGNILDKAAGDALYQPLATRLTNLVGVGWASGIVIPTLTSATAVTGKVVSTWAINTFMTCVDAATARSALGCLSMSTQASTNVSITGGSISNLTTFDGITIDGGTY